MNIRETVLNAVPRTWSTVKAICERGAFKDDSRIRPVLEHLALHGLIEWRLQQSPTVRRQYRRVPDTH